MINKQTLADLELEKVLDIVRLNSISKKGEKKISSDSITDDKKVIDQRADRIDQIIALIKIKGQSVNYFCSIDNIFIYKNYIWYTFEIVCAIFKINCYLL